jgi:hypothetical protein
MPHKEMAQEGAELTSVNTLKRNFSSARRRFRTEAKARNRVPAGPAAVCSRNEHAAGRTRMEVRSSAAQKRACHRHGQPDQQAEVDDRDAE